MHISKLNTNYCFYVTTADGNMFREIISFKSFQILNSAQLKQILFNSLKFATGVNNLNILNLIYLSCRYNDSNIIISFDKVGGVVIMDSTHYNNKIMELLNDKNIETNFSTSHK